MKYFPAFIDLNGHQTLVIADADAAARRRAVAKALLFFQAGASVAVGMDGASDRERFAREFAEAGGRGGLDFVSVPVWAQDIARYRLVVSARLDDRFNDRLVEWARDTKTLVNIVDRAEGSDYITPAIVERGDVVIGISTGGGSPVLGRRLREAIERLLPARLGDLVQFARRFRPAVKAAVAAQERRGFWERFFDSSIATDVLNGRTASAYGDMLSLVNHGAGAEPSSGQVFIVGTGPGDPDLLTLKALRAMAQADVVMYDKLIGPEILNFVRRDAERIFVGKTRACHSKTQDEINRAMEAHAKAGRVVVRLKGGDPFVFGRGGEELAYLREQGIKVGVVPGITAALGCAASVEMPLTHRDHAHAVTLVTGHGKADHDRVDWQGLARLNHTLVFYMGVARAGHISRSLIDAGADRSVPVALIENGTLDNERVVRGALWELQALVEDHQIEGPCLFVIGDVARLGRAGDLTLEDVTLRAMKELQDAERKIA